MEEKQLLNLGIEEEMSAKIIEKKSNTDIRVTWIESMIFFACYIFILFFILKVSRYK